MYRVSHLPTNPAVPQFMDISHSNSKINLLDKNNNHNNH